MYTFATIRHSIDIIVAIDPVFDFFTGIDKSKKTH